MLTPEEQELYKTIKCLGEIVKDQQKQIDALKAAQMKILEVLTNEI